MKKRYGFTIWELFVVVIIAVTLAVIAIPYMNRYLFERKSKIIATEINDAFRFARAEALRLNLPISICAASISTNNILFGCKGKTKNTDWSYGMLSFVDKHQSLKYYSKMRVRYNSFDNTTISNINIKGSSAFYLVNTDAIINIKEGGMKNLCFWFSQKSSDVNKSILLINQYGVSRFCDFSDYNSCAVLCQH